jgi:hypothetical protein
MGVPISVQTITTTVTDSDLPAACPVSNLTLPSFTASEATPAFVVDPGKSAASPGELIALSDSHDNQNTCSNLTYHFNFSGTATYTDSTSAGLKVSPAQSTYGQAVTLTAAVAGANPNSDSHLPTGTVSFYSCASASACSPSPSTLLGTGNLSGGTATFATSSLPLGNTYIQAVYPDSGTDYVGSHSDILTETVGYDSTVTGNQGGGFTVASGQAVEIASTGKVNGGATVKSGGILFLHGGTFDGGLTVQSGGTFNASGGTINGTVSISGAKSVSVCLVTVSGATSVTGSTGPVVIGNPTSCGANTFKTGLTVTGNTGGVTVSGNNVTGSVTVNNNTGPTSSPLQTLSANTISGGLACSGNTNLVDPQKNTVRGSRSGQCAGNF